jgi:hypothetical protein
MPPKKAASPFHSALGCQCIAVGHVDLKDCVGSAMRRAEPTCSRWVPAGCVHVVRQQCERWARSNLERRLVQSPTPPLAQLSREGRSPAPSPTRVLEQPFSRPLTGTGGQQDHSRESSRSLEGAARRQEERSRTRSVRVPLWESDSSPRPLEIARLGIEFAPGGAGQSAPRDGDAHATCRADSPQLRPLRQSLEPDRDISRRFLERCRRAALETPKECFIAGPP